MSHCPMCDERIHEEEPDVLVGEDTVHQHCAEFSDDVKSCAMCPRREYEDAVADAGWGIDAGELLCDRCLAARLAEVAADAAEEARTPRILAPAIGDLAALIGELRAETRETA